ncbi:Mog1/PsbP, alpha/beta/alpha sandwich [Ostreococcus tauri]|uniref:Mog1/PsbP, alpha/beta/alpha sandwich n=1 Tax=Ostreococcus tauri TaxID=70448 RepID=A0A090M7L7_OSTTA|nr:Mog1/PsbP, alpha/beta/alpha sandwich [Ostreococcus tauri]CEG01028.1 Mog1/PsbP, alpha/beta/alpha sandwich [Ostreococcus tauri]|eukprot:XP_003075035.2 Mog1/PsbP, alpha/beta/alpha sandwich [Ostreococcus tauri]
MPTTLSEAFHIRKLPRTAVRRQLQRTPRVASNSDGDSIKTQAKMQQAQGENVSRRLLGISSASSLVYMGVAPAKAIMGMTAGRVPGFSKVDDEGFRVYSRPEEKSGGHGVGWSEITPYSFRAIESWREAPVSIADPAGTEIDAKFVSESDGVLKIILAPIARFSNKVETDVIDLKELVSLENFIKGFAPELVGRPVQEDEIVSSSEFDMNGITYYNYELADHSLVSATARNKRVYICLVTCNSLQWRKSKDRNLALLHSFAVRVDN